MLNFLKRNKYPKIPKEYCQSFTDWTNFDTKETHKLIRFTTLNSVLLASNETSYSWYGLYQTYRGNYFLLNIWHSGFEIFPSDKSGALQWLKDNKKTLGESYYDVRAAFFDECFEIG